jgi:hypothetical protein
VRLRAPGGRRRGHGSHGERCAAAGAALPHTASAARCLWGCLLRGGRLWRRGVRARCADAGRMSAPRLHERVVDDELAVGLEALPERRGERRECMMGVTKRG